MPAVYSEGKKMHQVVSDKFRCFSFLESPEISAFSQLVWQMRPFEISPFLLFRK